MDTAFDDAITSVRDLAARGTIQDLLVDDLTRDDLPKITWSGAPSHIRSVTALLDRREAKGDVDYLCVRAPNGFPVAKGCVDYAEHAGAGEIMQLATHEAVQGLGLARMVVRAAEHRIAGRGVVVALLGVEDNNPRARTLYMRLGYEVSGRERVSWEREDDRGRLIMYETEITLLRKEVK